MYRAPESSLRCPMCGMANVLPPTRMKVSGNEALELELAVFENPDDRFVLEVRRYPVTHGRLCLDCGHVAVAVPEATRNQILAALSHLKPIT